MGDPWTIGAGKRPETPRQALRLAAVDKRGEVPGQLLVELSASLQPLDAGRLVDIFVAVNQTGDPDGPQARLIRSVRTLQAMLVDDDGVPLAWVPEEQADGKWCGYDGAVYEAPSAAAPSFELGSSLRKLVSLVEVSDDWAVRLDDLETAADRLTAASLGRPLRGLG